MEKQKKCIQPVSYTHLMKTAMGNAGIACNLFTGCTKTVPYTHLDVYKRQNQLYAECGSNPRDECNETEYHRGWNIDQACNLLLQGGYHLN